MHIHHQANMFLCTSLERIRSAESAASFGLTYNEVRINWSSIKLMTVEGPDFMRKLNHRHQMSKLVGSAQLFKSNNTVFNYCKK